jgi:predicted TIM-barrel fold metal-dependent hydrolase
VDEPYPFPTLRSYIREVVQAFGAERVFWGSDATRLPVPYREIRRQFTDDLDFLDDRERTLILGQAVSEWVRWPEPVR